MTEICAAHADDNASAIVFTGANGLFSAGADINDFNAELPPDAVTIRDVIAAVEASEKTHAAAIDGTCLGGALELALACDYRVATPRASLGLPEILLGLLPGAGGTQRLPRLIGARAALEFVLRGKAIPAERALQLGILDEVVPDGVVERAIALRRRAQAARQRPHGDHCERRLAASRALRRGASAQDGAAGRERRLRRAQAR